MKKVINWIRKYPAGVGYVFWGHSLMARDHKNPEPQKFQRKTLEKYG
jgi:hypothetical protein